MQPTFYYSKMRMVLLKQQFSNFKVFWTHLKGFLKQISGSYLQNSDSGGLGWNPRILISSKFPHDADVPGPRTTFRDLLSYNVLLDSHVI